MRSVFVSLLIMLLGAVTADADWPQFRGPTGQGSHAGPAVALRWSETENVTWKTEIPGQGWSSPVVVGNQIWLTTATQDGASLRAICVDRDRGRIVHNVEVFRRDQPERVHTQNNHASPTPVIVGNRVFVHFGTNGTACLSNQGQVLWRNDSLNYVTPHGAANSPVLHDELLIVCSDGEDRQFVTALHASSGKVAWQHDRNHLEDARRKSSEEKNASRKGLPFIAFSTPLVIEHSGQTMLVSTPADHVVANRVDTGEELWWMPYNCFSMVARPLYGNGLVYAIGGLKDGHYAIYAIRPESRGRVTADNLVWSRDESVPHVPSPLLIDDKLLMIKDGGIATCLDALTGQEVWQKRLGGNYRASPVRVGDTAYVLSQKGKCHVIQVGSEYKSLATNQLDGIFLASPACAGNSLFLRSDRHLYRVDAP